jgi:hypothetical protein
METKVNTTILAYLLALQDFSGLLSEQEQENLKTVAKDLEIQPKAWESYIEPSLIKTIQSNSQLHESYQFYKEKLEQLQEIPLDLLPKNNEIEQLQTNQSTLLDRGLLDLSSAVGYEQQLNNAVIVVSQNDDPTAAVKQLGFLSKMKQYLNQTSQ